MKQINKQKLNRIIKESINELKYLSNGSDDFSHNYYSDEQIINSLTKLFNQFGIFPIGRNFNGHGSAWCNFECDDTTEAIHTLAKNLGLPMKFITGYNAWGGSFHRVGTNDREISEYIKSKLADESISQELHNQLLLICTGNQNFKKVALQRHRWRVIENHHKLFQRIQVTEDTVLKVSSDGCVVLYSINHPESAEVQCTYIHNTYRVSATHLGTKSCPTTKWLVALAFPDEVDCEDEAARQELNSNFATRKLVITTKDGTTNPSLENLFVQWRSKNHNPGPNGPGGPDGGLRIPTNPDKNAQANQALEEAVSRAIRKILK